MSLINKFKRVSYVCLMLSTTLAFTYGSSRSPEEEIDRDIAYYSRMRQAERVNEIVSVTGAIATPILAAASGAFAFVPEPTGGTKIAAGVLGLSAIGIGATCAIIKHKAAKIEENNRKSISTNPTKSMITLERAIIQGKKKSAKLKSKRETLEGKEDNYEDLVDSKSGLQKIWAKVRLGYTKNQLEKVGIKLNVVDFHCQANEGKWKTKTKNNALVLVSVTDLNLIKEERKYLGKLNLLEGENTNEPIDIYFKAIRQDEYQIILNAIRAKKRSQG